MPEPSVLIVGGGAAGLSAAIASARLGAAVTLLEAGSRVGQKILASGNGRCNLTNHSVSPLAFNHPEFVEPVLGAYSSEVVRVFFGDIGLLTRADDEGRVYPVTNFAGSVLDALRLECAHLGVEVRCGFEVASISADSRADRFVVISTDGVTVPAHAVVVTTGGGGSLLADVGHRMIECVPVLGPIRTDTQPLRGLSGLRVRCAATLLAGSDDDEAGSEVVATERGELLFRDYGVSGIMIFDLSRYLKPRCVISIDFFPEIAPEELQAMIVQRSMALEWRAADTFFTGMLHDRLARAILRAAGVSSDTRVRDLPHARLSELLKDFRLNVTGMGDANQSQVTRGGASVEEFDSSTMASRRMDGLFAAGEVLDIDGRSGGFNLHWAWASGIAAGEAAARAAVKRVAQRDAPSRGSA